MKWTFSQWQMRIRALFRKTFPLEAGHHWPGASGPFPPLQTHARPALSQALLCQVLGTGFPISFLPRETPCVGSHADRLGVARWRGREWPKSSAQAEWVDLFFLNHSLSNCTKLLSFRTKEAIDLFHKIFFFISPNTPFFLQPHLQVQRPTCSTLSLSFFS